MELRDLVQAILKGDLLAARQWVADASQTPIAHGSSGTLLLVHKA